MKIAYEELVRQGRVKAYKARPAEIKQLLKVAQRDLATAERNLADDRDWAYTIAYNAVLQAARAFIFAQGFRPRGAEQHATVVQFVEEALGKPYAAQIALFDQMRRKRHRVIYSIPRRKLSQPRRCLGRGFTRIFAETGLPYIGLFLLELYAVRHAHFDQFA